VTYLSHQFYLAVVVLIQFYYHSSWSYTMLFKELFEPCPQMSITHTQILCLLNLASHVLNYSICKCANWVMWWFTNTYPKLKCNVYYLGIIVVTLISIVLLLHNSTLVWSNSHESYQDFVHALIKHKDFITYILLSPSLYQSFDLPN
jgi:hypothetical protein